MQETSALYKNLLLMDNHYFETKVVIDGHEINQSGIMSVNRQRPGMYEAKPTVGGALASTLNLTILKPSFTIPKMAEIKVYVRVCAGDAAGGSMIDGLLPVEDATIQNGYLVFGQDSGASIVNDYIVINNSSDVSEWLLQGIYYIDTRKTAGTYVETVQITAYDAMMKAEQDYPSTSHAWSYLDTSVVAEIAATMGVSVDSRVGGYLTAGYMIELPTNYTMREVLENIAACYCGNFVITSEGKLMFVPLYGLDPPEIGNYLADSNGTTALTFGNEGWYVIV